MLSNNPLHYFAMLVWSRRTDELVDGPNASHITPSALDRWEARLEDLFAGQPYDMLDASLSDTVVNFPVDIQACAIYHFFEYLLLLFLYLFVILLQFTAIQGHD